MRRVPVSAVKCLKNLITMIYFNAAYGLIRQKSSYFVVNTVLKELAMITCEKKIKILFHRVKIYFCRVREIETTTTRPDSTSSAQTNTLGTLVINFISHSI